MLLFLLAAPPRTATGAPRSTPPRRPSFWRALLRALAAWGV
jgi:hypothetical protein